MGSFFFISLSQLLCGFQRFNIFGVLGNDGTHEAHLVPQLGELVLPSQILQPLVGEILSLARASKLLSTIFS